MYVDGDLVPRSATKMPRHNKILKCHVKIRQKSWMRRSGIKRQSSILLFGSVQPKFNTSIRKLHWLCKNVSDFSEVQKRKHTQLKLSYLANSRRWKQNPWKRHEKFNQIRAYPGTMYNSSLKSSMSETLSSTLYGDEVVFPCNDNLYSAHGAIIWKSKRIQKLEKELSLPDRSIFRLYLHDSIGICSKFRPR